MKPNINEWTIVVVGNWNVAILSPDWVSQKVFNEREINIEVLFGAGQTGLRMSSGTIQLIPSADRVIVSTLSPNNVDEAEKATSRLLASLPVTPVSSVGVNFGFTEPEPSPELLSLFDLRDKASISNEGWTIAETSIVRALKLNEQTLNLRISHGAKGVLLHTNFHWNVTSTHEAIAVIEGKTVQLRNQAREILKKIYTLEEDGDE